MNLRIWSHWRNSKYSREVQPQKTRPLIWQLLPKKNHFNLGAQQAFSSVHILLACDEIWAICFYFLFLIFDDIWSPCFGLIRVRMKSVFCSAQLLDWMWIETKKKSILFYTNVKERLTWPKIQSTNSAIFVYHLLLFTLRHHAQTKCDTWVAVKRKSPKSLADQLEYNQKKKPRTSPTTSSRNWSFNRLQY